MARTAAVHKDIMANSVKEAQKPAHYELASPTLLAQQPADPKPKKPNQVEEADWNVLRSHLEARLVNLRAWRSSWWMTNWSDLAEFILPRRSIWLTQSAGGIPSPNNMSRGMEINQSIVDPTATFAARVCTGGLVSGLASPSRPWFKVVPAYQKMQIDAEGRKWLDEIQERLYTVLALSNFYNAFAQECEDLVVFGTAPSIIYEDKEDLIRCYNPCVGEYYLAAGATGRVDGFYRQFLMTIAQMVDFFGVENCSQEVQKMWQQKGSALEQERIICHAIEPNFGIDDGAGNKTVGIVPGNFTWREVYWIYGSGGSGPLSMRGFVDKPFTASRWSTQSNDAYGRSPGMDVLPDVLQLQVETSRKAEAIEKLVRPPLVADMTMKNQPSSSIPGSVTYVQKLSAESGMRPMYQVNPQLKEMTEDIAQIQQRIKVGLFNDLFLMLEQAVAGKMTAYEVAQKMQEKLQVLGPVIEGMLGELKNKLKRVYGIMQRKGMIEAAPDSLKNVPLNIQFVSLLALAQKAAATGGIERLTALVGNLVAVFPDIKDKLDSDQVVDTMNDLLGNPQSIVRGPEQVQAIRQQAAQQAQAASKMNAAQHMAQTASIGADAANTLSQTQIGGGQQALAAILGNGGNQ